MPVNYKIVKTGFHSKDDDEACKYRPGVTNREKMTDKELIEYLSEKYKMQRSDIVRVLYAFADELPNLLMENKSVEFAHLGTFSLHIKGSLANKPNEINSKNIEKVSVNFRASKDFKLQLKGVEFKKGE
jgi:nucleoid DNA-binding protein